jgi:uncharacterized membrane protein
MPLPLIPVIAALATGGTLVPHAAGGLIVTSASGYIAGTYVSTATITSLLAGSATAIGTGTAVVSGAAASVVGGAGIFGTTIGASGITGLLMSAGIIASTPVWVPVAIAGGGVGVSYIAFKYYKLREKVKKTPKGEEVLFSEAEAKVIEWLLRRFVKKEKSDKAKKAN